MKKALLTALFAVWLLNLSLNIDAVSKGEIPIKYLIKGLWKIPLFFIFPNPLLFYYIPDFPLVVFFSGLVNLSINRLSKKHAFSYSFKNRSKRFNSFFAYFIKGLFTSILVIIVNYSDRKEIYNFLRKKNIKLPYISLLERSSERLLIWIFFSIFYISLFYFIADKFIGFYKRRKSLKSKSLSQIKT